MGRVVALGLMLFLIVPASAGFAEENTGGKNSRVREEQKEREEAPKSVADEPQLPRQPVGARPPEKESATLEATTIFDQGGVLTPRGSFSVEPSFQYSHSSSNRVALVGYTIIPSITVGLIDIRTVESNTLVGALSVRYGITSRLELETKIPYAYRTDSSTSESAGEEGSNVTRVFTADGNGLGDVEFGLRYQINRFGGNNAYYIAGLRIKSNTGEDPFDVPIDSATGLATELPTGSGFWGIQPSVTVIVPSDPAVFFGSVSYMYNVSRTISGVGKIDPGDIIGFNFGMGFAINEKTSLSMGYDHNVVGRVKRNDELLPGTLLTQVGTLLVGYSYKYNEKFGLNLSLGAGLTQAAPDVQIALRVPYSF